MDKNRRNKAIGRYAAFWLMAISSAYFAFMLFHNLFMIDTVFEELTFKGYYVFGFLAGLMTSVCIFILSSTLTPIYWWVKGKITRKPKSFIELIINLKEV